MAIVHLHDVLALHVRISYSNCMKIDENLSSFVSMLVQVACSDHQRFQRYKLENAVISGSAERGIEHG